MTKTILVCLCLTAFQALAADCPVTFGDVNYSDKVVAHVQATTSCEAASTMVEACALGSSMDPAFTVVAERKCGLDFWKKLTKSDKDIYNSLQSKCDKKYANMQGTMYISFTAFCRLQVARLYSELYSPAQ